MAQFFQAYYTLIMLHTVGQEDDRSKEGGQKDRKPKGGDRCTDDCKWLSWLTWVEQDTLRTCILAIYLLYFFIYLLHSFNYYVTCFTHAYECPGPRYMALYKF